MDHHIVRCADCQTVLEQCQCMGPKLLKLRPGPCVFCRIEVKAEMLSASSTQTTTAS